MSEHTIESTPKYAVGDVVNNHRLNADGTWTPLFQGPPPPVVPVAQITPATLSEIILPSKKKSFGKRLVIGLVIGLAILLVGGIVSAAISGGKSAGTTPSTSTSQGLNDPVKLAASVKESYQTTLTKDGTGTVTDVTCVSQAIERQFQCVVTAAIGGQEVHASHTVTVNAAGDNWVAASEGN